MADEIKITITGEEASQFLERLSNLSSSVTNKVNRSFSEGALKTLSQDVETVTKNLDIATAGVETLQKTLKDIGGLSQGIKAFSDNVGKMATQTRDMTLLLDRAGQASNGLGTDLKTIEELLPKLDEALKGFSGAVDNGTRASNAIKHGSSIILNDLIKKFTQVQESAIRGIAAIGDPQKMAEMGKTSSEVQKLLGDMAALQHAGLDDAGRAAQALALQGKMQALLAETQKALGADIKRGNDIDRLQKILEKGSDHMKGHNDKMRSNIETGFDQLKNLNVVALSRTVKDGFKGLGEWRKDKKVLEAQAAKGGEEGAAAQATLGKLGATGGMLGAILSGIVTVLMGVDAENAEMNQGLLKFGAIGLGLDKEGGKNPFDTWQTKMRSFSDKVQELGSGSFHIPNEMLMGAAKSFNDAGVSMSRLGKYGTNFDEIMNTAAELSYQTGMDINRVSGLESELLATYKMGMGNIKQTIFQIGKQANDSGVGTESFLQAVTSTSQQTMLYRNSLSDTSNFLSKLTQTAQFSGKKGLEVGQRILGHLNQLNKGQEFTVLASINRNRMQAAMESKRDELKGKPDEDSKRQLAQLEYALSGNGFDPQKAQMAWNDLDSGRQNFAVAGRVFEDIEANGKLGDAGNGIVDPNKLSLYAAEMGYGGNTQGALEHIQALAKIGMRGFKTYAEMEVALKGKEIPKLDAEGKRTAADRWNEQFSKIQIMKDIMKNWLNGNGTIKSILETIRNSIKTLVDMLTGKEAKTQDETASAVHSGKDSVFGTADPEVLGASVMATERMNAAKPGFGGRFGNASSKGFTNSVQLRKDNVDYLKNVRTSKGLSAKEIQEKTKLSESASQKVSDASQTGNVDELEFAKFLQKEEGKESGGRSLSPQKMAALMSKFKKTVNSAVSVNMSHNNTYDLSRMVDFTSGGKKNSEYYGKNLSDRELASGSENQVDTSKPMYEQPRPPKPVPVKPVKPVKGIPNKPSTTIPTNTKAAAVAPNTVVVAEVVKPGDGKSVASKDAVKAPVPSSTRKGRPHGDTGGHT